MATSDALPASGAVSPRDEGAVAATQAPRMRPRRYVREIGWRHVVGFLGVAFALFPISWIVMSSINTIDSLTTASFIPDSTTFANFTSLFEGCSFSLGMPPFSCDSTTPFPLWLWNTVKIGLIASTVQLFMATLAAYSFARLRWRGRRLDVTERGPLERLSGEWWADDGGFDRACRVLLLASGERLWAFRDCRPGGGRGLFVAGVFD